MMTSSSDNITSVSLVRFSVFSVWDDGSPPLSLSDQKGSDKKEVDSIS